MTLWTNTPATPAAPEVVEQPAQPYVGIPGRATMAKWGDVNARIATLVRWMGEHGVTPAGPPIYRYWVVGGPDGDWDVEVAFPVADDGGTTAQAAAFDATVRAGAIEAGRYASWLHRGHPDQLAVAHERLYEWIADQGEQAATEIVDGTERWAGLFEIFLTDPSAQPDPEQWDTLLACRLT